MSLLSSLSLCSLLALSAAAIPPQVPLNSNNPSGPNVENARANAPQLFNAIHSSMVVSAFFFPLPDYFKSSEEDLLSASLLLNQELSYNFLEEDMLTSRS
jgi:hypothetical protein